MKACSGLTISKFGTSVWVGQQTMPKTCPSKTLTVERNAGLLLEADPTTLYYYKVGCKSRAGGMFSTRLVWKLPGQALKPQQTSRSKSPQAVLTNKQTWRNIQNPTTRLEVGIVITVFEEFLGKKRIKCRPINNS